MAALLINMREVLLLYIKFWKISEFMCRTADDIFVIHHCLRIHISDLLQYALLTVSHNICDIISSFSAVLHIKIINSVCVST
jgi:hypothetical protein